MGGRKTALFHMRTVKEVDENCRPVVIEVEVGPRYGDITNYENQRIVWVTERLGYFYNSVITWNRENQKHRIHWLGMDHHQTTRVLDILVNLGVIP